MEPEIISYAQVVTRALIFIAVGATFAVVWHFLLRFLRGRKFAAGLAGVFIESLHYPVLVYALGVSFLAAGSAVNTMLKVGLEVVLAPAGYLLKLGCIIAVMLLLINHASSYAVTIICGRVQKLERERVGKVATVVAKVLQLLVIIMAVLIAMDHFGFNITSIVALGSVGGLVIGLASQDILSNLLGRVTLYMEKPFSPGDHVICNGVEGIVTRMKWRITEIRTFERYIMYVPNNMIINNPVHNHSRRSHRRINQTIGIRYDDAGVLAKVIADVEKMLIAHDGINENDTMVVKFTGFGASSLDFMVYAILHETDWAKAKAVRHDVLLKIIDIVAANNAEFAFPTRTLHIANELPGDIAADD